MNPTDEPTPLRTRLKVFYDIAFERPAILQRLEGRDFTGSVHGGKINGARLQVFTYDDAPWCEHIY